MRRLRLGCALLLGAVGLTAASSTPNLSFGQWKLAHFGIGGGVERKISVMRVHGTLRGGGMEDEEGEDAGADGALARAAQALDKMGGDFPPELVGDACLLLRAVWMGETEVVESLLQSDEGRALLHNIVPDGGVLSGHNALQLATVKGLTDVVAMLVEHGGLKLIEATHPMAGYNALHAAALVGNANIVQLLGKKGGEPLLMSKQVKSAMADEQWEGAKVLSFFNHYVPDGDTVLHLAAGAGHTRVCELLLDMAPALATVKDKFGRTPSQVACVEGHMEAADAMEAICATNDVGFRMKDGTTVVHVMDPKIELKAMTAKHVIQKFEYLDKRFPTVASVLRAQAKNKELRDPALMSKMKRRRRMTTTYNNWLKRKHDPETGKYASAEARAKAAKAAAEEKKASAEKAKAAVAKEQTIETKG